MELNKQKLDELIKEYESQIEIKEEESKNPSEEEKIFLSKDYESFKKEKKMSSQPS
ncbi:MAG: hypothetical protein GXN99_01420, partial [Candidatus Nanohaloarchaeota archaeon]|nr:hypothetical protein [Candidatus Nanohaloarchaeota archaeon]